MAENIYALDASVLSNLAKSEIFSGASIGLDALLAADQRFLITPEVYFDAVMKNASSDEAQLIDNWIDSRVGLILNYDDVRTYNPPIANFMDPFYDNIGEHSIRQWISENKNDYSSQIISDDKVFRVAELAAGGIKDGDTVAVSVRDGALTVNGWPVKTAA